MKRGMGAKGAELNDGFKAGKEMTKLISPLAAKFVGSLKPILQGLDPARINNRVRTVLQRSYKQVGGIDYKYFKEFVFQPHYPLYNVLRYEPSFKTEEEYVLVHVPMSAGGAVKRQSEIVTSYRFALIMIVGDPFGEQELDTYEVKSEMYKMDMPMREGVS
jgi:hypothetical protein